MLNLFIEVEIHNQVRVIDCTLLSVWLAGWLYDHHDSRDKPVRGIWTKSECAFF